MNNSQVKAFLFKLAAGAPEPSQAYLARLYPTMPFAEVQSGTRLQAPVNPIQSRHTQPPGTFPGQDSRPAIAPVQPAGGKPRGEIPGEATGSDTYPEAVVGKAMSVGEKRAGVNTGLKAFLTKLAWGIDMDTAQGNPDVPAGAPAAVANQLQGRPGMRIPDTAAKRNVSYVPRAQDKPAPSQPARPAPAVHKPLPAPAPSRSQDYKGAQIGRDTGASGGSVSTPARGVASSTATVTHNK